MIKEPVLKAPIWACGAARQHKAWGVSPRSTVVKDSKPTKWATARKAAARFTGLMALQTWPGVPPSAPPRALLWRPLRGL